MLKVGEPGPTFDITHDFALPDTRGLFATGKATGRRMQRAAVVVVAISASSVDATFVLFRACAHRRRRARVKGLLQIGVALAREHE